MSNYILSTGMSLSYKSSEAADYIKLNDLKGVPELGNNAPEKVDITTLSDTAKKSMNGLSDTAQDLAFNFLFDEAQFNTLVNLNNEIDWKVSFEAVGDESQATSNLVATFKGTPTVKLGAGSAGGVMEYTLTISLTSEITFA